MINIDKVDNTLYTEVPKGFALDYLSGVRQMQLADGTYATYRYAHTASDQQGVKRTTVMVQVNPD